MSAPNESSAPKPIGHRHSTPKLSRVHTTAEGKPVDLTSVTKLYGAALAGCQECRDKLTPTVLAGPSAAVAQLARSAVEYLAWCADNCEGDALPDVSAFSSPMKHILGGGLDGGTSQEMERMVETMSLADRRLVLNDSLDSLVNMPDAHAALMLVQRMFADELSEED
jgi:hypothetical protein